MNPCVPQSASAIEAKRAKLRHEISDLQAKLDSAQAELEDKSQALAKVDKKYDILKAHFHSELEATKHKLDHEAAELAKACICLRCHLFLLVIFVLPGSC
jgi:chromosome segregation ATPase